jgi:8-oxo-dGTP diphosphatase
MTLRIRHAARAVVLDPEGRVLLTRFEFRDGRIVWTTVGGGLEDGETHEEAIRRELVEEAGLHVEELGPCIWTRDHHIPDPIWFDVQRERYFLVRTGTFEPVPALSWAALNAEGMTDLRWWTVEEILAAAGTRFGPRGLGLLLGDLLRNGPPPVPLAVGV